MRGCLKCACQCPRNWNPTGRFDDAVGAASVPSVLLVLRVDIGRDSAALNGKVQNVLRTIKVCWIVRGAVLVVIACAAGGFRCGKGNVPNADSDIVSGTVRLSKKLINYGSVAFYDVNGKPTKAIIMSDGTYSIHNPPQGEVKVVVRTGSPPMAMAAPDGGGGEPMKFEKIDIPAQYSDPEKTDLRFMVTPGKHQFDINLKPDP